MTDDSVTFHVPGIPISQGSHKAFMRGKRAVIVDDNAVKLKPWRLAVAKAADWAAAGRSFDCPVSVGYEFVMPRPQRPRFALMAVKPDLDKLQRAINDGMQDAGLLSDDSRIWEVTYARKRYVVPGEEPGAIITVTPW